MADAYLRRTLLPVEIVIGGSVCGLLGDLRLPYVRLLGTVESMDELYGQVDAVLAPLAFSTGLKIKVGEALSRGMPLVSHAHAFEGYVPTHPFHECADFEAMMRAVHRLVREPAELAALEQASRHSVVAAQDGILDTLREAGRRAAELPPSVVMSLRFDQARIGALAFDHALDAARYAGFRAPVVFHLAGDPAAADPAALRLLVARGRVVADPAAPLPPAVAEILFDDAKPRLQPLADLLAQPHLMAWFAALPAAPLAGPLRTKLGTCHLGALSLDGGLPAEGAMAALAGPFPRFLVQEEAPTRLGAATVQATGAARATVPLLWRGEECRLLAALRASEPGPVALLAEDPAAPAILPVLAHVTGTLGRDVVLFCPDPAALPPWPEAGPLAPRRGAVSAEPLATFFAPATWARRRPAFVLEHRSPAASLPAREVALRAGIAHLRFDDPAAPAVVSTAPAMSFRTRGFVSTALVLGLLDRRGDEVPVNAGAAEEYGRDAGWARIWGEIGRLLAA